MTKTYFRLLLLPILVFGATCTAVLGCTCEFYKHRVDFRRASAVVLGVVTRISEDTIPHDITDMRPQFSRSLTLDVKKRWKGNKQQQEKIWSYEIPYSCGGFKFVVGEEYLLYVYKAEAGSRYVTTACGRSRPTSKGGDTLQEQLNDLNRWSFRFWSKIWPFR